MEKKKLVCIECPIGCELEVFLENGEVTNVRGNTCPRGKYYAENEVTCPRRVVTSSVRAENGEIIRLNVPEEMYDGFDKNQTGILTVADGQLYGFELTEDSTS